MQKKKDDIIVRADEITARADGVGDTDAGASAIVTALVGGLQRQRRFTRWLLVSIILDLMLTIGLAYTVEQSNSQDAQIARNTHQQRYFCLSGNEFFKHDRELWEKVLALPAGPGLTPAQLAARQVRFQKIRGYLDIALKPRVC